MPSNWRGVRLLWEEDGFELVGAFCVAAFALGSAWIVLQGVLGLGSVAAGVLAAAAAAWALEAISRRHYATYGASAQRGARRAEAPPERASGRASRPPTTVRRPATEAGRAAAGERGDRSSRAA